MKRSRVNQIIAQADEMIRSFGFVLPPFAFGHRMLSRREQVEHAM